MGSAAIFLACGEAQNEFQQAEAPTTTIEASGTAGQSLEQEPLLNKLELSSFTLGGSDAAGLSANTLYVKLTYTTSLLNASMKITLKQPISAISFAEGKVQPDSSKFSGAP